jgi:ABC-type nitrate/sulfonate/bicarbonate transport system substrate-binding protein
MKKNVSKLLAALTCLLFVGGCQTQKEDIRIYMPDGAPSLAFAQLLHEDTERDGVSYYVVESSLIRTKVTYEDEAKNADLCVLPLTAATKLLGNGENYQMLGAVTHGNLYLVSKTGEEYTSANISTLVGKKIGVLQLNEVPGLIFKTTLNNLGVPYVENGEKQENAVNLFAIASPKEVGAYPDTDGYLIAEPAVSAQAAKGFACVGDIQRLYGGEDGYPQAVLVAKTALIENKQDWLHGFVQKLAGGASWLQSASAETVVSAVGAHFEDKTYAGVLNAKTLNAQVFARCGIRFEQAKTSGAKATAFLQAAKKVNDKMAVVPSEAFYCTLDFGV